MPKFGSVKFDNGYFDNKPIAPGFPKTSIHRIPLGVWVRKQIAKKIIFRVRPGNGYYSSKIGKKYQDMYKYYVPASINNPQGQPARNALAQAVLNWQTIITPAAKKEYQKKATHGLRMSGYNLYIREYIKANV